jgi:hypothetical protein
MAALIGIAPDLRAILAPHVSLKLMDRGRLRPAHNIQGNTATENSTKPVTVKIHHAGIAIVDQFTLAPPGE